MPDFEKIPQKISDLRSFDLDGTSFWVLDSYWLAHNINNTVLFCIVFTWKNYSEFGMTDAVHFIAVWSKHCVSFCLRETMIQSKPKFSTSKWTPQVLLSNNGSRKWRLYGRKWPVSGNMCAHCRMEVLWSMHRMMPRPASASACHHHRRCWVRSAQRRTFTGSDSLDHTNWLITSY